MQASVGQAITSRAKGLFMGVRTGRSFCFVAFGFSLLREKYLEVLNDREAKNSGGGTWCQRIHGR